ncbi:GOLPH3/VPS74 family protein [Jiangella mangrovi]|uniref:GPP34 family phosphoprotein n=1 Tax=Jiangella mangrovi TaxID=1524084 RepID=A0A7W9GWN8_9ACTN|nr:GPP34 family phosphoprotein [Jiangella mangrovi]MBB5791153.1 hypothetical protein [Jiangella mangrovi]
MENDLLIVEDLMLLLLDDDHGIPAGAGTLYYTLGGAMLVDLALRGRIEIDEGHAGLNGPKVLAVDGDPLADPLLRDAHEKVAEKPRGVQTLLITLGSGLDTQVVDRLVERGLLRREKKKLLRLFPTTSLEVEDGRHEAELRRRARAVLEDGAPPDPHTAAVLGLVSASGTLPSIRPALATWSSTTYQRAKELEQGHWGAEAVNAAVMRTAAAVAAASAVAITTVTTTTT